MGSSGQRRGRAGVFLSRVLRQRRSTKRMINNPSYAKKPELFHAVALQQQRLASLGLGPPVRRRKKPPPPQRPVRPSAAALSAAGSSVSAAASAQCSECSDDDEANPPPTLTLAQRMGLEAVPDPTLTAKEWAVISDHSKDQGRSNDPCAICLGEFTTEPQVLLPCALCVHCMRLQRSARALHVHRMCPAYALHAHRRCCFHARTSSTEPASARGSVTPSRAAVRSAASYTTRSALATTAPMPTAKSARRGGTAKGVVLVAAAPGQPLTARGALVLAHGGPLGPRAEQSYSHLALAVTAVELL